MKVEHSISVILTAISLAGILMLALAVSAIFVIRMRAITAVEVEASLKQQTSGIASKNPLPIWLFV